MLGNKRPRPASKGPAARDTPRGAAATGTKPAGKKTAGEVKESAAELGALSFEELLKGKFSGDVASETKPVGKPTKSAQPQPSRAQVSAPAPAAKRGVPAKGGAAAPPLKGRRAAEESEDEEDASEEEAADEEAADEEAAEAANASDADGIEDEDEAGSDEEGSGSDDDDALPDMATFKKQLASMAGSDPDFYSFLRHNDRKLVAAAEAESDEEEGAGEGDEEGAEGDEEEASDDAEDEGALDAAAEYEAGGVEEAEAEEDEVWDPRAEKKAAAAAAAKGKAGKAAADDEEEEEAEGLDGAVEGPPSLTSGMARAILKSAFEDKTFRGLARALHAYRACCFMGMSSDILQQLGLAPTHRQQQRGKGAAKREGKGDKPGDRSARRHTAEDDDEDADGARRRSVTLRYRIASSGVFMSVVTAMLEQAAAAFATHLGRRKGEAKGTPVPAAVAAGGPAARAPLAEYAGWAKLEPLVRSFLTATVELLRQAKDAGLRLFVLRALRPYIPYLQTLTPLTKRYTKVLLGLFAGAGAGASTGASPAEPEQAQSLIVAAFLRLRQMGAVLPHPTLDAVLKGLYRAFVGQAKFMSEEGAAAVLVQSHCVAEAFGVDEVAAYQHAFLYLRQLALQLRQALTTKTKEAVLVVYSWQYINCCRLWSSVLSRYATDPAKPLFQLVFPLTQILLGVARLVPTPRFYPLRLHVVGMLVELSWATRVYIPYLPLLLDILASPILTAKPSGVAATKPPALAFMVKVGKSTIGTRAFTDALVNKALDLLLDGCKAHYHSVALPEVVLPVLHALRTFAKTTRAAAWRGRARAIVDALVSQSAKVAAKRAALPAAPADRAAIATFMRAEGEAAAADRLRLREAAAASSLQEAQSRAEAARKEAAALAAAERRAGKLRAKRGAADEEEEEEEDGAEGEEDEYSSGDDAEYGQFLKPSAAKRRREEEEGDDEEEDGEEEEEDEEEGSGAGARASGKQVRFGGASAAGAGVGAASAASAARAAFASKHAAAAGAGGKGKAGAKPAAKTAPAPRKKGEDLVEDLDLDDL